MKPVVILVSPKGAGNVGSVARAMGNFGLDTLRVVDPRCDISSSECKQMAMHTYHIVRNAEVYSTFVEAHSDLEWTVALSGRDESKGRPFNNVFDFMQDFKDHFTAQERIGFVFGREDNGLSMDELNRCDFQIEIPTDIAMTSMNLSSAVAVTLSAYYFLQSRDLHHQKRALRETVIHRPLKSQEDLFFKRVASLMERIRYSNPQNPEHTLSDLKALYHRSQSSARELKILFGILSCVENQLDQIPKNPLLFDPAIFSDASDSSTPSS